MIAVTTEMPTEDAAKNNFSPRLEALHSYF